MITETLKRLIEIGYKSDCKELEALVIKRLNINADEILLKYVESERDYVDDYCSAHNIDLAMVMLNKGAMINLGEALITSDIKHRTYRKADQDKELVVLEVTTISITNGLETASKWMRVLGGAKNLQWVNRRAKVILDSSDITTEVSNEIEKAIEFLNENFISPDTLRPDVSKYWDIVEYPMSKEVEAYLLK